MVRKKHPWKICEPGSYYVKGHYKTLDSGKEVFWSAHCRKGKSKKSLLNFDEIQEIAKQFSKGKLKMPKAFDFKAPLGNKYDLLIAGWVAFWGDILGNETNISVDFVKTLIMSESSFRKDVTVKTHNNSGNATGLMQITDYSLKLAQEDQKELRDHVFNLKKDDLHDPNVNICVGVRWLHRKREIAKYYLKKEPSELELAEEYKGIRNDKSPMADIQRKTFKKHQKDYRKQSDDPIYTHHYYPYLFLYSSKSKEV